MPDYSDYEIDQYMWDKSGPMIPITGSKGCVRNCDFCDVRFQFGKYQFRTGKDIAKEMISLSQKHGYRKFQFTDSLVNGSLKVMKDLSSNKVIGLNEIKEYLDKRIDLSELKEKISIKTRQYAKRQSTWARGQMSDWKKIKFNNLKSFLKKFPKSA